MVASLREDDSMPTPEYFERKQNYIRKYNKAHYKTMSLTFRMDNPDEMEVYNHLRAQPSTASYLKALVKADIKKEG